MRRPDCAFALTALVLLASCASDEQGDRPSPVSDVTGVRFLGEAGSGNGFARATEPVHFEFPRDHGPHPAFRNEWWYFTGNLFDAERRHFGFELTFFRFGLEPGGSDQDASPATIWMANLAVTDPATETFFAAERLARADAVLAFARGSPLEVRVEDWSLIGTAPDTVVLRAADSGYALELSLEGIGDVVLQGERGLDRKGPETGNASYYYSAPRLRTRGQLTLPDEGSRPVEGTAWLDREWGTSALSPGIVGWDWFALQLSDGRDLMYYRLRTRDGDASEFSGGTIRSQQGDVTVLADQDVDAEVLERWVSPATGVSYPVRWRLTVPALQLDLEVEPVIPAQEIDLSVRYWEGAVVVEGDWNGRRVQGRGYLELAGYQ